MIIEENKGLFVRIPKTGSTSVFSAITGREPIDGAPLRHKVDTGVSIEGSQERKKNENISRYMSLFPGGAPTGLMHAPYSSWKSLHPEVAKIFSFTFVRNPWDWLISQYEFLKKIYKRRIVSMGSGTPASKYKNAELKEEFSKTLELLGTSFKDFIIDENSISFNSYIEYYFSSSEDNKTQSFFIKDAEGEIAVDYIAKTESIQEGWNYISSKIGVDSNKLKVLNSSTKSGSRKDYFESSQTRQIVDSGMGEDIERFQYEFGE